MFHIARDEEIKAGKVTDIYFARTYEILHQRGINPWTRAEIILKGFPEVGNGAFLRDSMRRCTFWKDCHRRGGDGGGHLVQYHAARDGN